MNAPRQDTSARDDLGTLAVMEAIAEEEQVTQRELSRRTGLNLKKVNYCLHKLLEKGHVKFQKAINNPDKRVYLYILTPAGMKEKSRLTYGFLKFSLGYYNRVEEKLGDCLREMEKAGIHTVVLCGATEAARIVTGLVAGNGIEVVGVLDPAFEGEEFSGVPVVDSKQLGELEWDGMLITALDDLEAVDGDLRAIGVLEEKVWRLS